MLTLLSRHEGKVQMRSLLLSICFAGFCLIVPGLAGATCEAGVDPITKKRFFESSANVLVRRQAGGTFAVKSSIRLDDASIAVALPLAFDGVHETLVKKGALVSIALGDGEVLSLPLAADAPPVPNASEGGIYTSWSLWVELTEAQVVQMRDAEVVMWRVGDGPSALQAEFNWAGKKLQKGLLKCLAGTLE